MNMMDKKELTEFRDDLIGLLSELKEKYDVDIKVGGINYTENEFTTKLTVSKKLSEEEKVKNFISKSMMMFFTDITEKDYRNKFKMNGKDYILIDIDTKRRKNCMVIEEVATGKSYIISHDDYISLRK